MKKIIGLANNTMSKCGHCGGLIWELAEVSPVGSNFKLFFVQCMTCKVPVGTMEYYNSGHEIQELKKELKADVQRLDHSVAVIDENVRRLFLKK